MSLLDLDVRWRRFHDECRKCPCCGQSFNGVFDIGFDHPSPWPHGELRDTGQDELQVGEDKLNTDLCRVDDHRFIRCILPFLIQGSDEVFHFGVWASVTAENFYAYIDNWTDGAPFDGCFGWLMNDLPGFDHEDVACDLRPGPEGQRPQMFAHDGPIHTAQQNGITFDQLLDIYAASGNDIRPHLTQ